MVTPTLTDSVELWLTLFERFGQQAAARAPRGRPLVYQPKALIVCFVVMPPRRLVRCTAPHRWRQPHPALRQHLRLPEGPHRPPCRVARRTSTPSCRTFLPCWGRMPKPSPPSAPVRLATQRRACARPRGLSGLRATARRGGFLTRSALSTRTPPEAQAVTTAGARAS
jgi:hypothetical protein